MDEVPIDCTADEDAFVCDDTPTEATSNISEEDGSTSKEDLFDLADFNSSDQDSQQANENSFSPLCPGANISVCGAYCAIMCLKTRCHLPLTAVGEILKLLKLLCPENNKLPSSVHSLTNFFSKFQSQRHKSEYCSNCQKKLDNSSCSNMQCSQHTGEPNVLQMDIKPQLQNILTRKFLVANFVLTQALL